MKFEEARREDVRRPSRAMIVRAPKLTTKFAGFLILVIFFIGIIHLINNPL